MKCTVAITLFLSIPVLCPAQTIWYVPDDFPTIQGAISSSLVVDGDTVMVKPGTYVENIDFLGKKIILKSSDGPEKTIIDGNKAGSVVTFLNGENLDSVLDGFTITNGYTSYDEGGGIRCRNASPVITNNHIKGNRSTYCGGGIYCFESSPIITNNDIIDNSAYYYYNGAGGGIWCQGSCATIMNNTITGNATPALFGHGGGIYCNNSSLTIMDNNITDNTSMYGGGICCGSLSSTNITNNIITNNSVGPGCGGGIYCGYSSMTISNNTITGNWAPHDGCGGGIYSVSSSLTITNNTITGNTAPVGGGISCYFETYLNITNTILWNNFAYGGKEIKIFASTVTIGYSVVEGGKTSIDQGGTLNWGDGMIDADPLFLDPLNDDFHLTWLSPCINRGTNDGAPSEDFEGDPRPYMGTVDMGVDEFAGIHPLAANGFSVSEVTGGAVNFTLTGGQDNNGRGYILLGGVTGTAPGTTLPGGLETLRLNWDVFTDFVVSLINTPVFSNFLGTLDPSGKATAQLNAPPVPGFAGVTMHYAYALSDPYDFVSNPVAIEIVP